MKKLFKLLVVVVVAFLLGTIVKSNSIASVEKENISIEEENKLLWDYYYASENLLDTLEMRYQWVDAVEDYYYYDAVEALYDNNLLIEE